jgi:exonuclease VII small subunit
VYFSCYDIGLSERASEYKHPSEEILKKREKLIRNLLSRDEKKDDDLHDGILFGLN